MQLKDYEHLEPMNMEQESFKKACRMACMTITHLYDHHYDDDSLSSASVDTLKDAVKVLLMCKEAKKL